MVVTLAPPSDGRRSAASGALVGRPTITGMRIGVVLMPTETWPDTMAEAQRLDRLGYHHLWVYDHLSWRHYRNGPWHATYPWLAAVAATTERIRLGTMVSNLNVRHPLTLAKDAMTIDQISGGRLVLGLGAGGLGFDAEALGQDPLTPGQRVDRLAEATDLLDGFLRLETEDHDGDWYTVKGARLLPGCAQQPRVPFAVAAGGPKALAVAARHGEAWVTFGDTSGAETTAAGAEAVVARQSAQLDDALDAVGRSRGSIDRILLMGHSEARPLASLESFRDFAGRHAELGFTDLVFHLPSDDPAWNDPPEIVDEIAEAFLTR